ncbi:hypothetical protein V1477_012967, partial [Vespula maculifrons]
MRISAVSRKPTGKNDLPPYPEDKRPTRISSFSRERPTIRSFSKDTRESSQFIKMVTVGIRKRLETVSDAEVDAEVDDEAEAVAEPNYIRRVQNRKIIRIIIHSTLALSISNSLRKSPRKQLDRERETSSRACHDYPFRPRLKGNVTLRVFHAYKVFVLMAVVAHKGALVNPCQTSHHGDSN